MSVFLTTILYTLPDSVNRHPRHYSTFSVYSFHCACDSFVWYYFKTVLKINGLNSRATQPLSTILCHKKKNKRDVKFFSPFSAIPFLSLYVRGCFNIWLTSVSLQNFFLWISSNHSPVTPWSHLISLFVFCSLLK